MSNYPDGMRSSYRTTIEMHCEKCGCEWEAEAIVDLGMCDLVNDADSECPECYIEKRKTWG
jgi:hypothetical protein